MIRDCPRELVEDVRKDYRQRPHEPVANYVDVIWIVAPGYANGVLCVEGFLRRVEK